MTSALHLTDGYKVDHRRQYPQNTVKVYSNFTPRKSRMAGVESIVFFGLTYFIKDVLIKQFNETFFQKDKQSVIAAYKRRLDNYLPGNQITYEHIVALHDLGYMPVTIKALPEGSVVKTNVPVLTITNELPEFFWIPNFLETILSCELWPGCTSLTSAFNYRLIFDSYAMQTVGNTEFSSTWQIHDFSARGMFGRHAAAISGAAHLCASYGSDTVWAIDFLEEFYSADSDKEIVAGSVPATEHSVMCMGMQDGELETFKRLINVIYPSGFVSIVSDTWDLWNVVRPITGIVATLKDDILARDGRVVIRPDSGDPVKILTGYKVFDFDAMIAGTLPEGTEPLHGEHGTSYEAIIFKGKYYRDIPVTVIETYPEQYYLSSSAIEMCREEAIGVVECLWETFDGTVSDKGYKVLDSHIGTIYGDSITLDRAREICERLKQKGFASINWVAGVGSYTYQYVTRDTFGFAMKATYGEIGHNLKIEVCDGAVYGTRADGSVVVMDNLSDAEIEALGLGEEGFYEIEPREIFKDPLTDRDPITGLSVKKSAKGLLRVDEQADGTYTLTDQVTDEEEALGALQVVYQNGQLVVDPTLASIRSLVNKNVAALIA